MSEKDQPGVYQVDLSAEEMNGESIIPEPYQFVRSLAFVVWMGMMTWQVSRGSWVLAIINGLVAAFYLWRLAVAGSNPTPKTKG